MKTTINGINCTLTTRIHQAPQDVNGNTRWDVEVLVDGKPLRDTIKGFRKVKNGYRVQAGSHEYNPEQAQKDVLDAVLATLDAHQPTSEPSVTSNGTKRSTHNTVASQIQAHVIECLSTDESTDLQEQLQDVADAFNNWYGDFEKKRMPNRQNAFIDWLHGLPSELSVEMYYHNQRELLNTWMGVPTKPFSDEQVDKTYFYLIFREFNKLTRMHDIQF